MWVLGLTGVSFVSEIDLESVGSSTGKFGGNERVKESSFLAGSEVTVVLDRGEVLHLVALVLGKVEAALDDAELVSVHGGGCDLV